MKRKLLITTSILMLAGASAACTPTVAQRGNMIEDVQLEQVVIGIHTRTDVLRLLGSPTTIAPFDEQTWYYIGQETEKRGILDPDVKEERIVRAQFDDNGVVQSLEQIDAERIDIPLERSKTKTHGNDSTAMQEFLGNLGRFNPQQGQQF